MLTPDGAPSNSAEPDPWPRPPAPDGEAAPGPTSRYRERRYNVTQAVAFRSTKARFGGLSNMAAGFPVVVGRVRARTVEALYQACRYPHLPELQEAILAEASPMSAKMVSKARYADSRPDWEATRVAVMRWCLALKLAQHFGPFGALLESTGFADIVEESAKDQFWGAVRSADGRELVGVNALGRLLMDLRRRYAAPERYTLLRVDPPRMPDLRLLGERVGVCDARPAFIADLVAAWGVKTPLPPPLTDAAKWWLAHADNTVPTVSSPAPSRDPR